MEYLVRFASHEGILTSEHWHSMNQKLTNKAPQATKLCLGFHLIDYSHKGYLEEQDFIGIAHAMHISLVSIGISSPTFDFLHFGKTLFSALANGKAFITPEDYMKTIVVCVWIYSV